MEEMKAHTLSSVDVYGNPSQTYPRTCFACGRLWYNGLTSSNLRGEAPLLLRHAIVIVVIVIIPALVRPHPLSAESKQRCVRAFVHGS